MKFLRGTLLALAFIGCCSLASAEGIPDPRIVIGGDTASIGVGLIFSFSASANGGGFYSDLDSGGFEGFYNASGVDWGTFAIKVPNAYYDGQPIEYDSDYYIISALDFYNGVLVTQKYDDSVPSWLLIEFYNSVPEPGPGILVNDHFFVDLRNLIWVNQGDTRYPIPAPDGSGGWFGANGLPLTFEAMGNPTADWLSTAPAPIPEPGSLVLLLGGFGLLGFLTFVRRRKNPNRM